MHDDLLERRLRSALRDEGDRLPFTITAAELEQRAALRGRGASNRRLTLLLAAAVAIGALGAGAILSRLSNRPAPSPIAILTAPLETAAPTARAVVLPSLDDLMAADPARVLAAQGYGPADVPPDPIPDVLLSPITSSWLGETEVQGGDYLVTAACLGRIPLEVDITSVEPGSTISGPRFACDGAAHEATIQVDGPAQASIRYRGATSWRVVVRGDRMQLPLPTVGPALPPLPEGLDELAQLQDATVEPGAESWGTSGLALRSLGGVPARQAYAAQLWCEPGGMIELVFGDTIDGVLRPTLEAAVACDGRFNEVPLLPTLPNGSPVFVAAPHGIRWSVRVESATPPIALAEDIPGWVVAGGVGPSLHFVESSVSFSDTAGDNGGPLMVVVECAGAERDIAVDIDRVGVLGDAFEHRSATCTRDGSRTTLTLDTGPSGYLVQQDAPLGTWTALTLLTKAGSPTP